MLRDNHQGRDKKPLSKDVVIHKSSIFDIELNSPNYRAKLISNIPINTLTLSQKITAICLVLYRIFDKKLLISFHENNDNSSEKAENNKTFIILSDFIMNLTLHELESYIKDSTQSIIPYSDDNIDISESSKLTNEIGIYLGKGDVIQDINHRLIFAISKNHIRIIGTQADNELIKAVQLSLIDIIIIYNKIIKCKSKLKNSDLISKQTFHKVIDKWNNKRSSYPKNKTIYHLFQEQAKRNSEKVAITCKVKQLTYSMLNEESNQLARYLRKQYLITNQEELKPDTLIAVCLERSIDIVIVILAILKAGAAYVPIDPNYPDERISYILNDTKSKILLTQDSLYLRLERITRSTNKEDKVNAKGFVA